MRRPTARDINQRKRAASTQIAGWAGGYPIFNPLSLRPFIWLDASDTSTITESGGDVSQWNDKSGNNRHFTQAVGTSQPKTGTTTQNGLNVIVFDGSNDVMTRTDTSVLSRFFTLAYVATPSSGTDDYHFYLFGGPPNNQQWSLITKYSSRAYEFYQAGTGAGGARFTLGATGATGYNTNIVIHRGSDVTSLVNGASSGSSVNGSTVDLTLASIFIGGVSTTQNNAGTNFAELIIFETALANQDLQNLSNYLRQKWATP